MSCINNSLDATMINLFLSDSTELVTVSWNSAAPVALNTWQVVQGSATTRRWPSGDHATAEGCMVSSLPHMRLPAGIVELEL